mmetsp:Transcript_47538/g.123107  ORF Transcript_47538/g.123107 Transcript_47538/m.123107 type:complete len:83 (+) Transcript_47538:3028-3276(+)
MLKGAPRKKALQGKGLVPDVPFSMFVHEPYQEKEDIAASLSKKGDKDLKPFIVSVSGLSQVTSKGKPIRPLSEAEKSSSLFR